MRVLVTGATGFIGRSLSPALRARGHEVRGVGREIVSLQAPLTGCHAVVHLANIAHSRASRDLLWRVNVDGTRSVAEQAVSAGVRRFLYVSSIKASGEETRDRPFDGTESPAPGGPYGEAKLAAERALSDIGRRSGLEIVIMRPPLVYGAGVKANFLALMRAIDAGWPLPFASIQNRRSLIYAENLCDAIAKCIEAPQAAGRTYVVGDGLPVSTPQLCDAIGKALGRPARIMRFPVAVLKLLPPLRQLVCSLEVDDRTLRKELGWQPPFSLEQGLVAAACSYRGG
jgi:nucleoside-diphosphate-sugar epimerase